MNHPREVVERRRQRLKRTAESDEPGAEIAVALLEAAGEEA